MLDSIEDKGYFGIGIVNCKRDTNLGTLWRSAFVLGASFIFTIGSTRFVSMIIDALKIFDLILNVDAVLIPLKVKKQPSDVFATWTKIPLYHYNTFEEFKRLV